jgi:nicotinamide phosphoribosyltransferase
MISKNYILSADSYKYSMHLQYPEGTKTVYSYIESRGGKYDELVYFGLQAYLREYLDVTITTADIDEAEEIITAHGEPFNRAGWEYIVNKLGGKLPLDIRGLDEGTIVTPGTVLVTISNTDDNCYWLTTFTETALLRAIWYPTTVASNSYCSKKEILKFLRQTGDESSIDFKLHDFGNRGVSSMESAALGGLAHLVNFKGTDTVSALIAGKRYYDIDMAGHSIPASEHSTITSWGRENEALAYKNMITKFSKPNSIYAVVSDSYDIINACKLWGTELKDAVISSGGMLVVRPDSGDPTTIVLQCISTLDRYFGHTINEKGFRVLNNVRVIQGDGIDTATIHSILFSLSIAGYSADNVAFGQGGALLQIVNRDDCKFAMKCSSILVNDTWRDVYKDPITDSGKRSKKGQFQVDSNLNVVPLGSISEKENKLKIRYINGMLINQTTFDEVRSRAANLSI